MLNVANDLGDESGRRSIPDEDEEAFVSVWAIATEHPSLTDKSSPEVQHY